MLKFYRNFSIVTFISLVIVFFLMTSMFRHVIRQQIIESVQHDSIVFIHFLENAVRQSPSLLNKLSRADKQSFRKTSEFTQLDNLVRNSSLTASLLRLNLYDEKGHTFYSTVPSQLDMTVSMQPYFVQAIRGNTGSRILHLKHFYDLKGITRDYDAVSIFVPMVWGGNKQVNAVAHLYVDLSGYSYSINKIYNTEYWLAAVLLLLLYLVLLQFIRRANKHAQFHESNIANLQTEIEQLVYRDKITELPNRVLFMERLDQAIKQADQHEKLLAVISLDINRFKYVNDKYGFEVGDALLLGVSDRLNRCVREDDTVARLHGGNFAILLEDMTDADEASESANQILEILSEPFDADGKQVFVTFCLGIAIYPFDDDNPETLLLKADSSLLHAKESGRNTYRLYNSDKRNKAIKSFSLENDLRHAFEREEFTIYYQPIVQIASGEVTGVEALLRWYSPTRGVIPPLEFISVLEDSGLIFKVGEWILKTACIQGKKWLDEGFGDLKININISARQFNDTDLLPVIEEALSQSKLPPHLLNLEITESLLLENRDRVLMMLDRLIEKGVSMSVDDFGTGYSSMAYLKNMPIETIKIDKSFVQGLPNDMDDIAIIHAIDYLSKNLRLNVIAEGVETARQLEFLSKLNVRAIQGYLVSRPVPAAELETVLRQHDSRKFRDQAVTQLLQANNLTG